METTPSSSFPYTNMSSTISLLNRLSFLGTNNARVTNNTLFDLCGSASVTGDWWAGDLHTLLSRLACHTRQPYGCVLDVFPASFLVVPITLRCPAPRIGGPSP